MFKLYINDIFGCLKFSTSILYADDTTIFLSGSSLRFLRTKMQSDLESLSCWLRANELKLNVQKTKAMIFHKDGLTPSIDLYTNQEQIKVVSEFNFLGITLDNSLGFVSHCDRLYSKLLRSSYVIRYLSHFLPSECLKVLYFAYFHSHLTYGLVVWFPLLKKSKQCLMSKMQKSIVRSIGRVLYRSHCMPFVC